jgi:histidinol-phosphatase (PHP family)
MRIDYHLHTRFSDGAGEPRDYAAIAVQRGFDEIGFSDHCPWMFDDAWHMKAAELPQYIEQIQAAQREFPKLSIKFGLEVDYAPDCESFVRELATKFPWDYFLGSVHYVGDFGIDSRAEDWKGKDVDQVWLDYFQLWTQAAQSGLYDSLAHPDLPKKFRFLPTTDFTGVFRTALKIAKNSGVAIEVSTAGLRKPCREIYPSKEFLAIAREFEIPVTLGSDAHLADDLGADFDKATALLRDVGYEKVLRFDKRKREFVDFD